jgi:hypothetical protein
LFVHHMPAGVQQGDFNQNHKEGDNVTGLSAGQDS